MNPNLATSINKDQSQHNVMQSLLWHILPGALTTLAFFALRPVAASIGYPPLFAFLLAVLLVDLPVMLGVMFYVGWQENGRFSLTNIIAFTEKLPWRSFIITFVIAFVVVFLLITATMPINNALTTTVFASLPQWLFLENPSQYEVYPKNVLLITFGVQLILTGIILPWVEELYFRGFLLSRLTPFGKLAPLLSGLFFGLYHLWQPHGFLTVFLIGTALGYVVWRTKDIRIAVGLHIFANFIARLVFLMIAIAM